MLQLPRSARLAAWGTAWLRGDLDADQVVRAVTQDDEPHVVTVAAGPTGVPGVPSQERPDGPPASSSAPVGPVGPDLAGLLVALRDGGVRGLRLVLPAPGDVLGLPGPAVFNEAAVVAGECVVADVGPARGAGLGAVPEVEVFGSAYEPGCYVTWTVHRTHPPRVTDVGSLAEADRALKEALGEAIDALADLDVARWREDAADQIAAIRSGVLDPRAAPPGTTGRAVQVLSSAARIRAIVELAVQDDGAAVNAHEARRRGQTLRELDTVARRGIVAAVNAGLEPWS